MKKNINGKVILSTMKFHIINCLARTSVYYKQGHKDAMDTTCQTSTWHIPFVININLYYNCIILLMNYITSHLNLKIF